MSPATIDEFSCATSLYALFSINAERTPHAIAITENGRHISYQELRQSVERLRSRLTARDVQPGELVGIALPRGRAVVTAILAVLSHGCGYVPLDPIYPEKRLVFMVADSGIRAAIAAESGSALLPPHVRRIEIEDTPKTDTLPSPVVASPPGTPAYLIYTSGSTGTPKGVEVPEQAVLDLFRSSARCFRFGASDVWTWFHSHSFDFSVWELWGALLFGGRIVVVPGDVARQPSRFLELLQTEHVTVLSQVPSAFKYLCKAYERKPNTLSLRYIIFGGEALDRPSVRRWMELRAGAETLVNMYGITETTVHVTYLELDMAHVAGNAGPTPIGVPLPHLTVALFDPEGRLVPRGTAGELYVAGTSLALGYHGRPDLTEQRFPTIANGGVPCRWYRSGDVARELADGSLEYIGRNDRQINLRGFRIELGEIEAVLRGHGSVLDAVVDVEEAAGSESILVAYVTCADAPVAGLPSEGALRAFCAIDLPSHMVPNRIHLVTTIPLTPSGKLDRARLRASASASH